MVALVTKYKSTAPSRCSAERTRSEAKNRSAISPTKKGEIMQANAVVPNTAPASRSGEFQIDREIRAERDVP